MTFPPPSLVFPPPSGLPAPLSVIPAFSPLSFPQFLAGIHRWGCMTAPVYARGGTNRLPRLTPCCHLPCSTSGRTRERIVSPNSRSSLCHTRSSLCRTRSDPFVIPAGPPLSFPPVFSGNPGAFSSVLLFVSPCMGNAMDSRLNMSGMTEGIEHVGHDGRACSGPLVMPAWPLCHTCSDPCHTRSDPLSYPL